VTTAITNAATKATTSTQTPLSIGNLLTGPPVWPRARVRRRTAPNPGRVDKVRDLIMDSVMIAPADHPPLSWREEISTLSQRSVPGP
jgi:hypothetical protein